MDDILQNSNQEKPGPNIRIIINSFRELLVNNTADGCYREFLDFENGRGHKISDPDNNTNNVKVKILFYSLLKTFDAYNNLCADTEIFPPAYDGDNIFKFYGNQWFVSFSDKKSFIPHSKGMAYCGYLLELGAYNYIKAVELQNIVSGNAVKDVVNSQDSYRDVSKANQLYKEYIEDIEQQLKDAENNHDIDKTEKLEAEQKYYKKLGQSLLMNAEHEKARQNVKKAITSALNSIKKLHPPLWEHLHDSIKTGYFVAYYPQKSVSWFV